MKKPARLQRTLTLNSSQRFIPHNFLGDEREIGREIDLYLYSSRLLLPSPSFFSPFSSPEEEGRREKISGEMSESPNEATTTVASRSSILDSIRGCGLSGFRIDKEELKRRILMPEYLRLAMVEAIRAKDADAGVEIWRSGSRIEVSPSEAPMVVFINSRSGGRLGNVLKKRLQELMGAEQVFLA